MKQIFKFPALLFLLLMMLSACEKQTDFAPEAEEPILKATKGPLPKITICHRTGQGNYITISVNKHALKGHLKHGDMVSFPNLLTYTWNFSTFGYTVYSHTMHITEMSDDTFSGYGVANFNPAITWILEDGMYDEDGNVSFTVTYTGAFAGASWDCTGVFACGEGASGPAEALNPMNPSGTWSITYP